MPGADNDRLLLVTAPPHVRDRGSVEKAMDQVLLALVPALLWSVATFGIRAAWVALLSVVSCMAFDELGARVLGNEGGYKDRSAAVTGLILALNLSSSSPWWLVVLGSAVAMLIGKQVFGGLGHNPFNPAIVARVVLLISYPSHMSTWPKPEPVFDPTVDVVTAATPLGALKADGLQAAHHIASWLDLFLGKVGGSMGEVSALALLIGGAYLLWRRVITWHIPVAFMGTVFVIGAIQYAIGGELALGPHYHLVAGGVVLGALFMATDYVTSPMTPLGQIVFGIGCGVITMVIRIFGSYPEGVSFAILLMNAFTPLIDRYTPPKRFGTQGA